MLILRSRDKTETLVNVYSRDSCRDFHRFSMCGCDRFYYKLSNLRNTYLCSYICLFNIWSHDAQSVFWQNHIAETRGAGPAPI